MEQICAISTSDNPFNPFYQFRQWFNFDNEKGYNSCALLARIAHTSPQLTDRENSEEIERAIDTIIMNDLTDKYIKVYN